VAERRTVEVWADWIGLATPTLVGALHATATRGKEVFSFEYASSWLHSEHAYELDPVLRLFRGPQYLPPTRDNFGVFLDSAPDRWGRTLLERREAQLAREQSRRPRRLMELDFLLGVYDGHRVGGLRYKIDDGPFLDDNVDLASPPWTSLRELEQASLHLEEEGAEEDPRYREWLRLLIAPGRSLGGARPKASVIDEHGDLWIAKFPSRDDRDDVGAWESVVNTLARRAGVRAAEATRQRFASRHHTFLTRRFDRVPQAERRGSARIHFCSAMTLLDRRDGEDGASYLELAQVMVRGGAEPRRDLEELWRRIVFSVCVSNIDDHLRNHGFLRERDGWVLAPAYDMNPIATGDGLSLNISETDNAQDLSLVRDVADHFRVKPARANEIIEHVVASVRTWRTEAENAGISRADQERMAPAFELAES
jgi:serine/threonine-protein kinase HipA